MEAKTKCVTFLCAERRGKNVSDTMVRATACDGLIRCFTVKSTDVVEKARQYHGTSPVMTAALGRLLTGGLMMGRMMKNDKDILTIKIDCQGEAKGLLVTADSNGNIKGLVENPIVNLPPNAKGKLDVAGALGLGVLSVIKDIGLKEPYVGQTILVTSEIAEDLTYYFANSEQIPTSVGLGVLMNKDNTVNVAGGFIVQLMPGADSDTAEDMISKLEANVARITSVTSLLADGMSPTDLANYVLEGLDPVINDEIEVAYTCDCSKDRFGKKMLALGKKELDSLLSAGEDVEVGCVFCNKKYVFTVDELKGYINN